MFHAGQKALGIGNRLNFDDNRFRTKIERPNSRSVSVNQFKNTCLVHIEGNWEAFQPAVEKQSSVGRSKEVTLDLFVCLFVDPGSQKNELTSSLAFAEAPNFLVFFSYVKIRDVQGGAFF